MSGAWGEMTYMATPVNPPSPRVSSSPILVIGHLRPDTDSATSAVVYAALLQRQNRTAQFEGVICDEPIPQTRWLFEQAGLPLPRQVKSLRLQVGAVMRREVFSVAPNASLGDTIRIIQERRVSFVPVVASDGKFCGALSDRLPMAQFFYHFNMEDYMGVLFHFNDLVGALRLESWRDISRTADGKVTLEPARVEPGDVLLIGDDPAILELAAQRQAAAVIVCAPRKTAAWQRALRLHHGPGVYRFRGSLMALASVLPTAIPVENVMSRDVESLRPGQPLGEVRALLAKCPYPLPVLDDSGNLLGLLSRSDALAAPAPKVILVDHFERHQAVDGLDEAEIVEIVDHHRVGALETRQPIRVDCRPVGSTATIVAMKWQEAGMALSRAEATLLLGGLLADTLLLTSPTTTDTDRKLAARLARIAGVKLVEFGRELLARNDEIVTGGIEALLERDLKEFAEGRIRFAVAQVETVDRTQVTPERLEGFEEAMRVRRERAGWDFLALLITDTLRGDSIVLIDDPDPLRFERLSGGRGQAAVWPKCVSRKKQFLPVLLEQLAQSVRS